jgi:hypothetical protein
VVTRETEDEAALAGVPDTAGVPREDGALHRLDGLEELREIEETA